MSQMGKFASLSTPIETLTGNTGGAVGPAGNPANIDLIGSDPITVTGNPATNTLTFSVATATTTQIGVTTLATNAETIAGTSTTKVTTPDDIKAKLGTQTTNGIAYGAGTAAALQWTSAGTNGQLIIGATGSSPTFATLTSTGSTIAYTAGANSLNLETGSIVATSFPTDSGTALPSSGVLNINGGTGINTTGSGNTVTINTNGTTISTYTLVNTTPYTVLSTDQYLGVDSSGGPITVALPNAPSTGRIYNIKDSTGSAATQNITVTTVGGLINIDGATTFVINTGYEAINVIFNGTSYEVF